MIFKFLLNHAIVFGVFGQWGECVFLNFGCHELFSNGYFLWEMVILILEAHFSDNKSYSGGSSWTLGRSMDGARLLFWRIIWMVQDFYSGGSYGWYKTVILEDQIKEDWWLIFPEDFLDIKEEILGRRGANQAVPGEDTRLVVNRIWYRMQPVHHGGFQFVF